jgi:hypothetical protein
MTWAAVGPGGCINLQATLSASSAGRESAEVSPHHPICCTGELELDLEDRAFRCQHAVVPLAEQRTVMCLQHSVAILIIEEAVARFGLVLPA